MQTNDVQYLWRAALVSTAVITAAVNQTLPAIVALALALLLTVDSSPDKDTNP
jgi:hypothetical protein